jgi:hypothetical protein
VLWIGLNVVGYQIDISTKLLLIDFKKPNYSIQNFNYSKTITTMFNRYYQNLTNIFLGFYILVQIVFYHFSAQNITFITCFKLCITQKCFILNFSVFKISMYHCWCSYFFDISICNCWCSESRCLHFWYYVGTW